MTQADITMLRNGASVYGVSLCSSAVERFQQFEALLTDWNRRTNLVSKNDMSRLVTHHFLDSLKLASAVHIGESARILDFGSGAGFPGIPLAIAFDHAVVYLVESRKKRCAFLSEVTGEIGLENVTVLCSRVESLGADFDCSFSLVATRATESLPSFHALTSRFLAPGGSLAAIKGEDIEEEYERLNDTVDGKVFNILRTRPPVVQGVRTGWIVSFTRDELSTQRSR